MSANTNFRVQRLEKEDLELAVALAASMCDLHDPRCEAWGLAPGSPPAKVDSVWGLFVNDSLTGSAWTFAQPSGVVISALVLPRGQWGMGLVGFMVDAIATATNAGELHVCVAAGGHGLGEALEGAGFVGPDLLDEKYPVGDWKRPVAFNN